MMSPVIGSFTKKKKKQNKIIPVPPKIAINEADKMKKSRIFSRVIESFRNLIRLASS